jgi:hypothetical protein
MFLKYIWGWFAIEFLCVYIERQESGLLHLHLQYDLGLNQIKDVFASRLLQSSFHSSLSFDLFNAKQTAHLLYYLPTQTL